MMNNMFQIFDPSSSNYFSFNWIFLFLIMMFIPKYYFWMNNRILVLMYNIFYYIMNSIKTNLKKSQYKNMIMFMIYFIMIYLMNLLSIFPFIFCPTSHLTVTMALSFPFWFSLMFKGWIENPIFMFSHLVPSNTPFSLCVFMVLIETISNIIRPLTLSIRLTANMIAGHVLMALLSMMLNNNFIIFYFTSLVLIILMILEMFVAMIQSYVFITLLSLYMNEIL